ncbi:hypothetical protein [Parasitella parasitica]|uniref:Uncharacterized protein n=1 Tax=Parasitella parasitica TaxID=35722 RepID=A0A0B7N1F3_9FUNG|nr:hypothetical protein [Parasitella parasitica]
MSIIEAKRQLSDAIAKYEHLKSELNSKSNLESYSEEEWHAHLKNLGLETAQLIHTSRVLDDDNLINLINRKQQKLKRHAVWKKKHKKRVQQRKRQQAKKNEKWIKDTEWKVTMSPSVNAAVALTSTASLPSTDSKQAQEQADDKNRIRFLTKKLALLTEIRALRRKKLEAKGHFFADDGNEFFNKVKESLQVSDPTELDTLQQQNQQQQQQAAEKKLSIHPQDTWHDMAIDKTAYGYWCGADQSLDALLKTRRLWDQYILLDKQDNDTFHKVPPTFVAPAPPANAIWASYLRL